MTQVDVVGLRSEIEDASRRKDLERMTSLAEQSIGNADPIVHALGLWARGNVHWVQDHYEDAQQDLSDALETFERCNSVVDAVAALSSIGVVYYMTSRTALARETLTSALDRGRDVLSPRRTASILLCLALVDREDGDDDTALKRNLEALELYSLDGDIAGEANILGNIASIYQLKGQYTEALTSFARSLDLQRQVGNGIGEANAYANLSGLYAIIGDHAQALTYSTQALVIYERLNLPRLTAIRRCENGILCWYAGDRSEAECQVQLGIEIYTKLGSDDGLAHGYMCLGDIKQMDGDSPAALMAYRRAEDHYRRVGDERGRLQALILTIDALMQLHRYDEVRYLLPEIEGFDREDHFRAFDIHSIRGALLEADAKYPEAWEEWSDALMIADNARLMQSKVVALEHLRDIAKVTRDFDRYVETSEQHDALRMTLIGKEQQDRLDQAESRRRISEERLLLERQRSVLVNMLPETIADRMLRGEQRIVEHFPSVSVMFLDLVNFTQLAGRISPQELIDLLNTMFTLCDRIIDAHRLTKIKTIGDAYLAVGNAPESLEHHVRQIVRAAIQIRDGIRALDAGVDVRIGLHVGPVVGGVVGNSRTAWDVWGDTVNVASRMESTSEPGRVHVSEAFAMQLNAAPLTAETLILLPRGDVQVKGKGAMRTFYLERQ